MKILVDKMPEKTKDCIFGQNGPMFRGHRYCDISSGTHYCLDPNDCPYLMSITEITPPAPIPAPGIMDAMLDFISEKEKEK